MNKKLVVAVTTALIIANGSSVAMATGGSDDSSTTSTSCTSVPRTQNNTNLTAAQQARCAAKQAQDEAIAKRKAELAKYLQTRRAINTAFSTAMVNAQREFKAARESATDRRSINIATRARLEAVQAATRAKNAALRALGAPPVKPSQP